MVAGWLAFRALRWLAWIGFFAFCFYFTSNRAPHLNSFGHLLPITELYLYGLPTLGVFAGLLELMMREKAGLPRPALGQLIPPRQS